MKTKVQKMQIGIVLLFLLGACAPSNNQELLKGTQILSSAEYGYTPENPVEIWPPTAKAKKHNKTIFLEGLRSRNGVKYEIIEKDSVPNPIPTTKLHDLKSILFFLITTHVKDNTLVPVGLSFSGN